MRIISPSSQNLLSHLLIFIFHSRTLSSSALDALKDFYKERDEREKRFAELQAVAEAAAAAKAKAAADALAAAAAADALLPDLSMAAFTEDWNKSQFWVSPCLFWN